MCFPALLNLMMPIWTGKKRREGRQRNRKSKDFCYVVPEQAGRFPVPQNEHYKKYQAGFRKTLCPRSHCAGDIPQADNWRFFTNGASRWQNTSTSGWSQVAPKKLAASTLVRDKQDIRRIPPALGHYILVNLNSEM